MSFLQNLDSKKVRRFVFVSLTEKIKYVRLNGFCDSSTKVFCAVIYIHVGTSFGVKLSFLTSKTKLAPMKTLTITTLELLGSFSLSPLIEEGVLTASSSVLMEYSAGLIGR